MGKMFIRAIVILLILAINVGCDQVSKNIVRKKVAYNASIKIWDDYFTLTKVENKGAFLSLGNNLPPQIKFFILSLIPLICIVLAIIFLITRTQFSKTLSIAICFMIGGGIGNIYDRIMYGSVTDFLHIDFVIFQTGIFNLADVSIMTGMFILLIDMYLRRNDKEGLEA